MNSVILMGRLTAEPELKRTQTGKDVLPFTLAVNRDYGKDKQADFINCVAWEGTAKFIAQWFRKGSLIAVEGGIQTRPWQDKQGNKRTATEVLVRQAHFTGEKSGKVSADIERDDFAPAPIPTYNVTAFASQTPPPPSNTSFNDFAEVSGNDNDLPF